MVKQVVWGFAGIIAMFGIAYTGYSGWYSYRISIGESLTNHETCVDGVPVASAAGIELTSRRFHWVWVLMLSG